MSVKTVDPVHLSSVDQHLGPQFDIFLEIETFDAARRRNRSAACF